MWYNAYFILVGSIPMFPAHFGKTQLDDIKLLVDHYKLKRKKAEIHFKYMGFHIVGSRIWMADILGNSDIDKNTRAILEGMIQDTDCDVRFEPANAQAQEYVTALTISNLRNIITGINEPGIDSYANFEWKSLDVAINAQCASIVNGPDVRMNPETGEKIFDSDRHKDAYYQWINNLIIETIGLKKYIDSVKHVKMEENYSAISYIERTLRSYIKPLKVGHFSLRTLKIIKAILHDNAYDHLKGEVIKIIQRRISKNLMPNSIQEPSDLFMILEQGIDRSFVYHAKELEKEYIKIQQYLETSPNTIWVYFHRKFEALMEAMPVKPQDLSLEKFPDLKFKPANPGKTAEDNYINQRTALDEIKEMKAQVLTVIDKNESVIEKLSDMLLQTIMAKQSTNSPIEKIKHPEKQKQDSLKKVKRPHPQSEEKDDGLDTFLNTLPSASSSTTSQASAGVTEPVKKIISYDQSIQEAYAELINIDSENNKIILKTLLNGKGSLYQEMKALNTSFLHVIAVLRSIHDKDEVDFYAKDIIQKSSVYKELAPPLKNPTPKIRMDMTLRIRDFASRIDQMISQSTNAFAAATGDVDPAYIRDPAKHELAVYQTLASCKWDLNDRLKNIYNLVGVMRYLSHFYSFEACSKGLLMAVFVDHHFCLKMSFPFEFKAFIDWLFIFKPFSTHPQQSLVFKDVVFIVKLFFPQYKMTPEDGKYVFELIQKYKTIHAEYVKSEYIVQGVQEIRKGVLGRVKNVDDIFKLRTDAIHDPDMAILGPHDLFYDEIEGLKSAFMKDASANAYHLMYFLKHSEHCSKSAFYRDAFLPIYDLLEPSEISLFGSHKEGAGFDNEVLHDRLVSLIFVLKKLNLCISVDEKPECSADEYNYVAKNTNYCLKHFIACAMTLTENMSHQTQLYVLYEYARTPGNCNRAFNKVFMGSYTVPQLIAEEKAFREQAALLLKSTEMPLLNQYTSPTLSSTSASLDSGSTTLYCDETLSDKEVVDFEPDKNASLTNKITI